MSDSYEAKYPNLKYPVSSVLSHKEVCPESCDSLFDLDVEPAEVLPVQEHKRDQLLVDLLWESLNWKPGDVCFHEAEELIQNFAFHANHLTKWWQKRENTV